MDCWKTLFKVVIRSERHWVPGHRKPLRQPFTPRIRTLLREGNSKRWKLKTARLCSPCVRFTKDRKTSMLRVTKSSAKICRWSRWTLSVKSNLQLPQIWIMTKFWGVFKKPRLECRTRNHSRRTGIRKWSTSATFSRKSIPNMTFGSFSTAESTSWWIHRPLWKV